MFKFERKLYLLAFIIAVTLTNVNCVEGPVKIIQNLIQNNLLGAPVVHQITKWDFDPEVAIKRREVFQHVNGFRGEKLIERMGIGIDGNHNERLEKQRARDEGLLGGTIHHIKHGLNTLGRV